MSTNPLALPRLIQTVEYHARLCAQLKAQVDSLAVKMGIDPEKDLLMIPLSMLKEYGWKHQDFPPWIRASAYFGQAEVLRGVRAEEKPPTQEEDNLDE